jgi:uncharacterized protein YcaQ
MADISITLSEARCLALFGQGFYTDRSTPVSKVDVNQLISKLGIIQIDTINIVARAPYFSVWSRVGEYDPNWINELLEEINRRRLPGYDRWYESHKVEADKVLEHVRENGSVRSVDFERTDGIRGAWWNWKSEKEALEYWFVVGELMVSKRVNFQRVYDLRERI